MSEDQRYPLDPLSSAEIAVAVDVIKGSPSYPRGGLFPLIVLSEPPKEKVLAFQAGSPLHREVFAIVLDRAQNRAFETVVVLKDRKILSWKHVPDVQPLVVESEYEEVSRLVKADVRWREAMQKRGIDPEDVQVDGWAVGHVEIADAAGARLLRAVSYYRGKSNNFYGRPIEGVVALVNLNSGIVVDVSDTGTVPLPPPGQELDENSTAQSTGSLRPAPNPLVISQPKGASFEISGNEVRWQKWRFRFALHPS